MGIPQGLATALSLIGLLLVGFGILDVVLANFFEIDITGVSWSPIAAWVSGGLLLKLFSDDDE